nr:retrovirus-related Pol polyprotein from transposon TNT 1-94 [Tanacetum cinerariifolium]
MEMDTYNHSTPISTKLPILDTGKFKQWKFIIQQYLQHEHYALWEVIEFGDSYKAPPDETAKDKGLAGEVSSSTKNKGRIVAISAEDIQKRKNDVKARTTLLLALPDEHQLRFSKYDSAKELWKTILKTFGGNEPPKRQRRSVEASIWFKREHGQTHKIWPLFLHRGKSKVPTVQGASTASAQVPTISIDVAAASLSYDTPLMILDGIEAEEDKASKNHALVADEEEVPIEYALMAKSSSSSDNEKDLSWMGLPEFVDNTVTDYTKPTPSIDVSKSVTKEQEERWKSNQPSFFEQEGSSGNVVTNPIIKFVKESSCPNATKVNNTENVRKPIVKYAEIYRNTSQSPRVRGNQKNWNNQKSQQLGKDFIIQNKACYNCGSFDHLEFNYNHDTWVDKGKTWTRVNHAQDNMKYTSTQKSLTPRAVLLKYGTKPINMPFSTARPTLKSAQPKMTSFVKTARSNVKRPFERKSTTKNKVWSLTIRPKIPTVGSKVPTAKPAVAADKGNKGKAVKALARWIWKPKQTSFDQGSNFNGVSVTFKKYQYIDTQGRLKSDSGCSRHMTGNISYLSEYEPFNGGYVSFGHGRGKITGEFRNKEMDKFYSRKGIKREFSNARTPQQNGVAKRRNRTFIEAVRTMLADAKLPVTFWAEAVNTACYVQNRVLVTKPHNKTPYELFNERSIAIGFLRPFGCHVMILNTLDHLGKYKRRCTSRLKDKESHLRFIALPNWFHEAQMATSNEAAKKDDTRTPQKEQQEVNRDKEVPESSQTQISLLVQKSPLMTHLSLLQAQRWKLKFPLGRSSFPETLSLGNVMSFENMLEDFFGDTSKEDSLNEVEADLSNMETAIQVSPTPTLRIHKDHPKSQIIGPVDTHEERIDYEEVFLPVAMIEAIRLFLAYASYMGFTVYQMDVKSAFLYGTIDEEVYVMQPLGFQDPEFSHRVYKVEKAMKHKGEFLLVQVYVDDIIFGSSNPKLCREFEALMYKKFQMSAMGELKFFLGLQVLQKKDGIFLSQDKYVGDILKKFGYTNIRAAKTPMDRENPWGKDGTGKYVELHLYRSMIGSLMYLTASRPDIMFAVCACARHQVTSKECHLHVVKRIFRYLKGNPKLGLWYPKESPFDLVAYSDNDYGGANQDQNPPLKVVSFWKEG